MKLVRPAVEPDVDQNKKNLTTDCCTCPKSKNDIRIEEDERKYQILFENFLLDKMTRKK